MEKIAEVEMPPHSKRPRLDIAESGLDSPGYFDKAMPQESKGKNADAGFQACNNGFADFSRSENGVMKNKMADGVSADPLESEGQFSDASEDEKETPDSDVGDNSDSDISNLSGASEMAWRPIAGPMAWVQQQMLAGRDPRVILRRIIPDPDIIPDHLEDFMLWKIVAGIVSEPPRRKKLKHINTIDDVVNLLKTSKKIMVLTGAGVSVSCGIPDFRSRNGIYARLAVDFPDLPDPQAMFDINYFRHDPRPFFKFAKEIYPGQFEPSHCHKFISLLDRQGKLLRNYTQNIDTLEQVAGIKNVIQCHGSFATATCMNCRYKVDSEAIRKDIFDQVIPHCPRCSPSSTEAVMKPDIVFFGESLPEEFHTQMAADKDVCDLLIVVGSSLKVRPVALIPNSIPGNIPQVLINREPLRHLNFDVELLGDCDVILGELCHRLGGECSDLFTEYFGLEELTRGDLPTPTPSEGDAGKTFLTRPHEDICQPSSNVTESVTSTPAHMCSSKTSKNSHVTSPEEKFTGQVSSSETQINISSEPSNADSSSKTETKDTCTVNASGETGVWNSEPRGDNHESARSTQGDNSSRNSESLDHSSVHCNGESSTTLEKLRDWWQSKHSSISNRLTRNQFLYVPPHRYVFSGAEVYDDSDSEDGQFDDQSDESSLSDIGEDEEARADGGDPCEAGTTKTDNHEEDCDDQNNTSGSVVTSAGEVKITPVREAGDGSSVDGNGHEIDSFDNEKLSSHSLSLTDVKRKSEQDVSSCLQGGDCVDPCSEQNGATSSNVRWTDPNSDH